MRMQLLPTATHRLALRMESGWRRASSTIRCKSRAVLSSGLSATTSNVGTPAVDVCHFPEAHVAQKSQPRPAFNPIFDVCPKSSVRQVR